MNTHARNGTPAPPDRWRKVERLFAEACEHPPDERADFLARACTGDPMLQHEIESLLAAHEKAGNDFLASLDEERVAELIRAGMPAKGSRADATRATHVLDLVRSALAGRYAIGRELGHGGMATVYLAEDLKHHRNVAVKVLRPELAAVLGAERFLNEIEVTAKLQHPHILPLFDSGEAEAFLYYVMPYVEGETLREKLNREKQLAVEEAIRIAEQVATALEYAHGEGVVHRDIKPENVLLEAGQAVVADFGIALAVTAAGGTRLTETGLSLGTPEYMSPEQLAGDREVDARSDVYSLGTVVYEMLVGEPPHHGNSAHAIMAKILSETPAPVSQTRDMLPANVDAAVYKALAKSPADRFTGAAKFTAALTDPAFALPTTRAAAEGARAADWRQRIAVPLAVLAILLGVVALWGWLRFPPNEAKPVARYGIVLPEGETREAVPFGRLGLALSPDGSRFVYVGPGERGTQLWVRSRAELHARPIPGTDGAYDPFFSPDGSRLAFFVGDLPYVRLMVVSLGGGQPRAVADPDSAVDRGGGSWGSDGFLYVDGQLNGDGLARVPEAGGRAEPVTMPDTAQGELWHTSPDALPNGKGVLFTVWQGGALRENSIAVVNLATGTHEVLVRGTRAVYAASGHVLYTTRDGTLMAAPFDQDELSLTGEPTALVDSVHRREFAVSTSGTLLHSTPPAGALDVGQVVVWVTREGVEEVIDSIARGSIGRVSLSPDGTRLAFEIGEFGGTDVWIKQLVQGPLQKLTVEGADWNWAPSWPDSRSVTFVRGWPFGAEVVGRRADGSGSAQVLFQHRTLRNAGPGAWSRDGQWYVYGAGNDLYALRPNVDSVPVPVVVSQFEISSPALAPNGRWLAYVSDESGTNEVYVVPFPSTRDGKWLVSTEGGVTPMWAHSERELFYRSVAGELIAVAVSDEGGFAIGARRVLFPVTGYTRSYDVALDDGRFVMVKSTGSDDVSAGVIVVENFFEELKAKLGN